MGKITLIILFFALLVGCAGRQPPTSIEAYQAAKPRATPVRNLTPYSESLRCMDNLFLKYRVEPLFISSAGLPHQAGDKEKLASARVMLISTISEMARKSDSVRFIDLPSLANGLNLQGVEKPDLRLLQQYVQTVIKPGRVQMPDKAAFKYPEYLLIGAISQFDRNTITQTQSASLSLPDFDFGIGQDQLKSVVTLDMNVVDAVNLQVVNGLSSVNSIAVVRKNRAGDLGGRIKKAGLYFDITYDRSEGLHQAIRTLVQVGTIETLGRLAQVPYWQCLDIEATNPLAVEQAQVWYAKMDFEQRLLFVQRRLAQLRFYQGEVHGRSDVVTREAIARYRTAAGLLPGGDVDFYLYQKLMDHPQAVVATALSLHLTTDKTRYQVGENMKIRLQSNQDAFVHCYYQQTNQTVLKLFPNRFHPKSRLRGGIPLPIPGEMPFELRFSSGGSSERVQCIAAQRPLEVGLPASLRMADLETVPQRTLEAISALYRKVHGEGLVERSVELRVR